MRTALIREQMERIFGDQFSPVEVVGDEMPLLASGDVPEDIVAMVTSLEEEDYVDGTELTGSDNQLIYGAWAFDEANGTEGTLAQLIEDGNLPQGLFEVGEHLVVDSQGTFPQGKEGAVYYVSSDYALEDAEEVAESILELLSKMA